MYQPGPLQGKPDALSRRSEFTPKEGDDAHDQQKSILLKPELFHSAIPRITENENVLTRLCATYPTLIDDPVIKTIKTDLPTDSWAQGILKKLQDSTDTTVDLITRQDYELKNQLLYYKGLLYVPAGPA